MIWWQSECKFGDMIRISCGNFYHYGIFVSEEEVIQFGLPPFEGLLNRKFEDIAVCISDIYTFAGGRIVEVVSMEKSDRKKRLSPEKTVKRARECLGEKGYDILHNNCEHFARYCYLGEKRCEATECIVREWKKKTISDVYFSIVPNEIEYEELQPPARNTEVMLLGNENLKKSKYWVWKTLEYALFRSFGYKIQDLDIVKTKNGKWVSKKCYFSLSRSDNIVAVIVSNQEIGIDIEECISFYSKVREENTFQSFAMKILSSKELYPQDKNELLKLWTKKECLFKVSKRNMFIPNKTCTVNRNVSTFQIAYNKKDYMVSVIGKDKSIFRFYGYDGDSATKYQDIKWI